MDPNKEWLGGMTFDKMVDWAAGHILTELIAGRYRSGVYMALSQLARWRQIQDERKAESPVAAAGDVWVLISPQDYQRATVLGVYSNEAVARRALATEKENLRAAGDMAYAYLQLEAHRVS